MIISGVVSVISGSKNLNVLANLISTITYEDLFTVTRGQLNITRQEYDAFIAEQGKALMDAGVLDANFVPTGQISVRM